MDQLREALLLAAAFDIHIHAVRVTTAENTLADAISRFDWQTIANLCPNWQPPLCLSRPRIL